MASPSPATNGAVVCFTFGTGCIHTFDMEGKEAWNLDLVKAYGPNTLLFGYSSSPLLYKDRLIIQMLRNKKPDQYPNRVPEGADSRPVKPYLLALDLDSGRVLWQQPRPNDAVKESQEAYTTPVPFSGGGAPGFLVLGGDCLTAHDVRTGEEWWRWCGYNPDRIGHWRVVPTPVVHGGKAFVAAPKHNPLYAIALAPERHAQPRERTCVEWTFPTFTPDASSPLIYRDRIYLLQDDTSRLHCLDPDSGNAIWSGNVGLKAVIRASLTGADGKIYAVSEKGEVVVLAAGDAFSVLHRTQIDGAPVQSSIVAANGCLYLRTARELLCFSLPPE